MSYHFRSENVTVLYIDSFIKEVMKKLHDWEKLETYTTSINDRRNL